MEVGEKSPWAEGDISIHNSSFSTRKQWPVNLSAMISSVILTADEDTLQKRILSRNPADKDLAKLSQVKPFQKKLEQGLKRYNFPHTILDCNDFTPEEIQTKMLRILRNKQIL